MLRFVLIFLGVLMVLFRIDMLDVVQQTYIQPLNAGLAHVSAALMQLWHSGIEQQGNVLWDASAGFGVRIESGCNGVEAMLVLVAAVVAFPSTLWQKAVGVFWGVLAVQAANLLRIISLFYLGLWNQAIFEFAHLYLWQALIMLDVMAVWFIWMRWLHAANKQLDSSNPATDVQTSELPQVGSS